MQCRTFLVMPVFFGIWAPWYCTVRGDYEETVLASMETLMLMAIQYVPFLRQISHLNLHMYWSSKWQKGGTIRLSTTLKRPYERGMRLLVSWEKGWRKLRMWFVPFWSWQGIFLVICVRVETFNLLLKSQSILRNRLVSCSRFLEVHCDVNFWSCSRSLQARKMAIQALMLFSARTEPPVPEACAENAWLLVVVYTVPEAAFCSANKIIATLIVNQFDQMLGKRSCCLASDTLFRAWVTPTSL